MKYKIVASIKLQKKKTHNSMSRSKMIKLQILKLQTRAFPRKARERINSTVDVPGVPVTFAIWFSFLRHLYALHMCKKEKAICALWRRNGPVRCDRGNYFFDKVGGKFSLQDVRYKSSYFNMFTRINGVCIIWLY